MIQGEDAAEEGRNLELNEAVAEHAREARVSERALCLQGEDTFDWLSLGPDLSLHKLFFKSLFLYSR